MYLSTARAGASLRGSRLVAANVVALGLVSCVTDISAELVTAILPAYLVLGLHLSLSQYGIVDGIYAGATALTRLAGGYVADRFRQRKLIAGVGYGLSAIAKLGLLAAGAIPAAIGAVLVGDRIGKGLRTAPRDAMITLSTPPAQLGRAFGVHRTLDSLGAFAGPLVATIILTSTHQAYDAVFMASFCAAALGVVLLGLLVRDRREAVAPVAVSLRQALRLCANPAVRRLLLAAGLLGLATIGDGFVYLILSRRDDLAISTFPLLAAGVNLAYLVLATPLGLLADRFGRRWVYLAGYLALIGVYALLAAGKGWLPLILALYGAFYAATDGVLMALAGPLLPESFRTSGLALIQTGQALAYLVSSVLFGFVSQNAGVATACLFAAVATAVFLPVSGLLLSRRTA